MTQLTLGEGMVDVCHITHKGEHGILLKNRKEAGTIGEETPLDDATEEYQPGAGDIIIWFKTEKSIDIFSSTVTQTKEFLTGDKNDQEN